MTWEFGCWPLTVQYLELWISRRWRSFYVFMPISAHVLQFLLSNAGIYSLYHSSILGHYLNVQYIYQITFRKESACSALPCYWRLASVNMGARARHNFVYTTILRNARFCNVARWFSTSTATWMACRDALHLTVSDRHDSSPPFHGPLASLQDSNFLRIRPEHASPL